MAISSGGSGRQRHEEGGVLEGSWVWIALPVGILVLIAALWFLVIAPAGGQPPRATITPARAATAWPTLTPMVVTAPTETPLAAAPTATATTPAQPTTIGVGARVQVVGTGAAKLRMRQTPGTSGTTVKLMPDGTELVVTAGPQDASGYTWWKVQDPTGAEGWVAAQYLALVP